MYIEIHVFPYGIIFVIIQSPRPRRISTCRMFHATTILKDVASVLFIACLAFLAVCLAVPMSLNRRFY